MKLMRINIIKNSFILLDSIVFEDVEFFTYFGSVVFIDGGLE